MRTGVADDRVRPTRTAVIGMLGDSAYVAHAPPTKTSARAAPRGTPRRAGRPRARRPRSARRSRRPARSTSRRVVVQRTSSERRSASTARSGAHAETEVGRAPRPSRSRCPVPEAPGTAAATTNQATGSRRQCRGAGVPRRANATSAQRARRGEEEPFSLRQRRAGQQHRGDAAAATAHRRRATTRPAGRRRRRRRRRGRPPAA